MHSYGPFESIVNSFHSKPKSNAFLLPEPYPSVNLGIFSPFQFFVELSHILKQTNKMLEFK